MATRAVWLICISPGHLTNCILAPNVGGFNDYKDINNFVDHGGMPLQWNPYPYDAGTEQDFVDPALQGYMPDPATYIAHAHHQPEAYNH